MTQKERVRLQVNILRDLGELKAENVAVLDLGCGNGGVVNEYRDKGFSAYGCDFQFKEGSEVSRMESEGIIRKIDQQEYRLPFDDNRFDVVVSDQVFEHVKDYAATLSEIQRVLKPGGRSLNIFPSRFTPIEPHVFVPLATIFQMRWWLYLWALLGIRTGEQKGVSAKDRAKHNHKYLVSNTNYLTKSEIVHHIDRYFDDIQFCENLFLKHSRRGKILFRLSKVFVFLPNLYGAFRARVIAFRKPC